MTSRPSAAPAHAYAQTGFASATPIRQRLALLDAAIAATERAVNALEQGPSSLEEAHRQSSTCRAILLELAGTIRSDAMPSLAGAMTGLYVHMHGQMVLAMTQRNPRLARSVTRLLASERGAWIARLERATRQAGVLDGADAVA